MTPEGSRRAAFITVIAAPVPADVGLAAPQLAAVLDQSRRARGGFLLLEPPSLGTAEQVAARQNSQYYATYNRTLLMERVQAVLDAVALARGRAETVDLLGILEAGVWTLLALPQAGPVGRAVCDAAGWDWPADLPAGHAMYLPGIRGMGGMKAVLALARAGQLAVHNTRSVVDASWLQRTWPAKTGLTVKQNAADPAEISSWLFDGR
jgi:hypothetical protein